MDKPTCETCRWWRLDTRLNSLGDSGSCLRYAPRPITRLYSEWTDDDDAAGLDTLVADTDTTGVTVSGQSSDQAYAAPVLTDNLDGTIAIEYRAFNRK